MIKGLLWLPLLAVFIGLAWAGWNEYQKLESYRVWAAQFQKAKYDIYAVLGQNGSDLTWGKPTRQGPTHLQTFSLKDVESLELRVDGQPIDPQQSTSAGRQIGLRFQVSSLDNPIDVPFTDFSLAAKWATYLTNEWQSYRAN
ncbi:MAG: hypothetical protein ACFE0I_10955 [Elainellaceae cyanobacterium]